MVPKINTIIELYVRFLEQKCFEHTLLKDYAEQKEIALADTIIEFDRITLNAL